MKLRYVIAVFAVAGIWSCKKNGDNLRPISSFTLVNATTDVVTAKAYATIATVHWKTLPASDAAGQYNSALLTAWAGSNSIRAVSAADTTVALFASTHGEMFEAGAANTLFLHGSTGSYNGVFIRSDVLVNHTDSVLGIRLINLSPNSTPLSVTLSTTASVNEVSGLAYRSISNFKTYPALQATAAMTFQLRDGSGTLLASYTLPVAGTGTYATSGIANARFKNLTLVIKGLQGTTTGTNALGIFPVPHY